MIYLNKITVASISFFCVAFPISICSLLPVNELIHYASRSYFPGVPIQNNLKNMAINAAQENCHVCVSRYFGRFKPCSWLKGDSIHCNGLHRKSIGKNNCSKMLFQANVRLKNISIKLLVLTGDTRIYGLFSYSVYAVSFFFQNNEHF